MSPAALKLLSASGNALVKQLGLDVVRGVVFDVLMGRNLRDSTELLTRQRIAALNLAIVNLFLQGSVISDNFVSQLPDLATEILVRKGLNKADRWIAQWVLGLTDKAFQNVLRDDPEALNEYRNRYIQTCRKVISNYTHTYGELGGELRKMCFRCPKNWPLSQDMLLHLKANYTVC